MRFQPELYPPNWHELAHNCKDRAGWRCEHCGAPERSIKIGETTGKEYIVRLAAAHVDHDPENPDPRLVSLCQGCHMSYDGKQHGLNAQKARYRNQRQRMINAGQLELWK